MNSKTTIPVHLPEAFVARTLEREGEQAQPWLTSLPEVMRELCHRWNLLADGEIQHGEWAVVLPVLRGREPLALKVSWPQDNGSHERVVEVLKLWKGHGAVKLIGDDAAQRAQLLERLEAQTTLASLPIQDALLVAGKLLRRLALPAPAHFPRLEDALRRLPESLPHRWEALGKPFDQAILAKTMRLAQAGHSGQSLVVNWDLHHGNVLRGQREPWLVTDPQVISGELEYALCPLLWWRLDDIEAAGGVDWAVQTLSQAANLDLQRARAWAYLRSVDYWLMGLEWGLTLDPVRCERVVTALEPLLEHA